MDFIIKAVNEYLSAELTTLIVSVLPLIELKGSILFARASGIGFWLSLLYSYIGSTIVFFPIFFLLVPILNLLKKIKWFNKLALKIEGYFSQKATTLKEKKQGKGLSETGMKMLGVFLFVAIPLPMTGVWTGKAIAVFLNLKFKDAILPIVIGNIIAGGLIVALTVVCEIVKVNLDYVLYALFALALVLLVVMILKICLNKPKSETQTQDDKNLND